VLIVGERINSARKSIYEAIANNDKGLIQKEALAQVEAGADYIDLSASSFKGEEEERLKWLVLTVQEITDAPLCLDSPDTTVIKSVIGLSEKAPMINSVTLEDERAADILKLAAEYSAKVIGLCQSGKGIASTVEAKLEAAEKIIEKAVYLGVPIQNLYVDPILYPVATDQKSPAATLEAIDQIMTKFRGAHTICGLTNISYGLPNRKLINRAFLVAAMTKGMDSAIIDPTDRKLYSILIASSLVLGNDEDCMGFINAHRGNRLE